MPKQFGRNHQDFVETFLNLYPSASEKNGYYVEKVERCGEQIIIDLKFSELENPAFILQNGK